MAYRFRFRRKIPVVWLTASAASFTEGGGVTVTLHRSGPYKYPLTVDVRIGGTLADDEIDYDEADGVTQVTIPAGVDTLPLTITSVDDADVEGTELFSISITESDRYTRLLAQSAVEVSVLDNDVVVGPGLPEISIAAITGSINENGGAGKFRFSRTGPTTGTLTITYTVGGTAAPADYTPSLGTTIQFGVGQSTVDRDFTAVNNSQVTGNKTVVLTISPSGSYNVASSGSAVITILEDDSVSLPEVAVTATDPSASELGAGSATFLFSRSGSTAAPLEVRYSVGGTAQYPQDYSAVPPATGTITIPAGAGSTTLVITPVNEGVYEGDTESVLITLLADPAYTIGTPASQTALIVEASSPPAPSTEHPRIWLNAGTLPTLRANIAADSPPGRKARWQAFVTDFESAGSYFTGTTKERMDPYTLSIAAFLACVRTPSNDLGLTWAYSHTHYVDRAIEATFNTGANAWNHTGHTPFHAAAHPMIYDWLYDYLTDQERAQLVTWMTDLASTANPLKFISSASHWDDQGTDEHLAKLMCFVALEDWEDRLTQPLSESQRWAEAHEHMQMGEGIGYAFKNSVVGSVGPVLSLYTLKKAYGLTDAATTDKCLVSLRDSVPLLRHMAMPHAGYNHIRSWGQIRVNFQAPEARYHGGANIGSMILWAMHILPGKVDVSLTDDHTHGGLIATNETALLGYLRHISDNKHSSMSTDQQMIRHATNAKWPLTTSPTSTRGHLHVVYALPPWLIEHVTLPAEQTPDAAGIPRIRRWWPGTLNWVTMIGGVRESLSQSTIVYSHRRWFNNAYTAVVRQNGMWQAFWGGQLLFKRGAASHGPMGKRTEAGNGCVTFVDLDLYEEFGDLVGLGSDLGGIRAGAATHSTYEEMLAASDADYGQITRFHSSDKCVALTSDLTLSYNSTLRTSGGDPAKISSFTREFVATQRNADGVDRHKIFTYDRIAVLGSGRYQPRYALCPPLNPTIDGVETAYTPHYPDPAGVSINEPDGATWKTTGPVRWDYAGASKLIFDAATLPRPVFGGTGPGNGKVQVTWLRPSSATAVVQKRGGTAQYFDPTFNNAQYNNCPHFDQRGALLGMDGQWHTSNNSERQQFVGMYGVQVWHNAFNANTRFFMATEVMATGQTPETPVELTCDAASVAARCGATGVCFKESDGTRTSGSVTIPSGVTYFILTNLAPSALRTLTPGGGLTIVSPERTADAAGVLEIELSGSGTLTWS